MQAIQTKYLGPTGGARSRGARIVAKCAAKRIVVGWNYECDEPANHAIAAKRLANQLGWLDGRRLESGSLPDGTYAHVLVAENVATLGAAIARYMGIAEKDT